MRTRVSTLSTLALSALLALPAIADTTAAGSTVVDVIAPDGVELAATYTSPGRPGPGVLLLHMCNSDRSAWTGLAAQLAARGIHSLALDYRGYGDSGGVRLEDAAQQQVRAEMWPGDVDAAFELLRSRPGVDRARIGAGETRKAIEILALNVEAFPHSANALDSLGDAYLAAGQPAEAADFARRAIAAIPDDPVISEDFAQAIRESAESKLAAAPEEAGD